MKKQKDSLVRIDPETAVRVRSWITGQAERRELRFSMAAAVRWLVRKAMLHDEAKTNYLKK